MIFFFFFNDTATTEIYTLSLHDALPISQKVLHDIKLVDGHDYAVLANELAANTGLDRKSTRLNSSHLVISYAVFCLKKKNNEWVATHPPRPLLADDSRDAIYGEERD